MPTVIAARDALTQTNPFYVKHFVGETIIFVVTTICVLAKCVVRKYYLKTWDVEDWMVLLSWLLTTAAGSVLFAAVQNGAGHHSGDLTLDQVHIALHLQNTTTIIYALAAFTVKTSVLCVYIKIFVPKKESRTRWLFIGLIAANAIFYISSMFMKMFECYPREKIWMPELEEGYCVIKLSLLLTVSGIWNTVSDLLILSLPAIFISRLRLDPRRKWKIIGIFTLGSLLYPVFSIIGVVIRVKLSKGTDATNWQPPILLFALTSLFSSQAELGAGIVCACLPSVGFVLRQIRSRKLRYTDLDRQQLRRGSDGRLVSPTKFGFLGHSTAMVGVGPDTQHLDHVLDNIDLEAKAHVRAEKLAAQAAGGWSVTRIGSGRGSGGQNGRMVPDAGMPPIVEITSREEGGKGGAGTAGMVAGSVEGEGIWKTTEVTVRYDDVSEETNIGSEIEGNGGSRTLEQRARSPN